MDKNSQECEPTQLSKATQIIEHNQLITKEQYRITRLKNFVAQDDFSDDPYLVIKDLLSKGFHVIKGRPFTEGFYNYYIFLMLLTQSDFQLIGKAVIKEDIVKLIKKTKETKPKKSKISKKSKKSNQIFEVVHYALMVRLLLVLKSVIEFF